MKAFVHGVSLRKGEFTRRETGEVIPYDNVIFHVSFPSTDPLIYGDEVLQIKMKRSLVNLSDDKICSLPGSDVIFDIVPKSNGTGFNYSGITVIG